jgi:hypothetical protein
MTRPTRPWSRSDALSPPEAVSRPEALSPSEALSRPDGLSAPEALSRPDWRDTISTAADLALVGFVVVVGCLPVVTAGAALATASVAVDHLCRTRSLPPVGDLARTFARSLPGGVLALCAGAAGALLIGIDLRLLAAGTIPGGPVAVALIALVGSLLVTVVCATVVRVGQTGGTGWVPAFSWSHRLLRVRPQSVFAVLVTVAVPVTLALAVPVLVFVLPGFALFALHAVVRRAAA